MNKKIFVFIFLISFLASPVYADAYPRLPYKELIFPQWSMSSSHAPSIVELPNGDLFAVWYAPPSWSNTSAIWSSRRPAGSNGWSAPVMMHATLHHSNKNPVLYLRKDGKLLLFWTDEKRWWKWVIDTLQVKVSEDMGRTWSKARDAGVPTGYLPKNHLVRLNNGSLIFPLYMDWNTSAATAISKDDGMTWEKPVYMLFLFGIQPTIIQRSDSSLFALMRCGMPPRLAWQATSDNFGRSWKDHRYSVVNNPGTALEMIKLRNGHVVLTFNNAKKGLSALHIALSLDEGKSWPYVKTIEFKSEEPNTYPSVIQDRNGLIHVLYAYRCRSSIAHFVTDEEWIKGK